MFFVSWQQTFLIQEVALRAPALAKAAAGARRVKYIKSFSLSLSCTHWLFSRFRGSTAAEKKTTFVIFAKHKFRFCSWCGAIHIKASAEASRGGILSIWTVPPSRGALSYGPQPTHVYTQKTRCQCGNFFHGPSPLE